jgi:hypothetical protein
MFPSAICNALWLSNPVCSLIADAHQSPSYPTSDTVGPQCSALAPRSPGPPLPHLPRLRRNLFHDSRASRDTTWMLTILLQGCMVTDGLRDVVEVVGDSGRDIGSKNVLQEETQAVLQTGTSPFSSTPIEGHSYSYRTQINVLA